MGGEEIYQQTLSAPSHHILYTHQPAPLAMALHPAGGQFVCNVLWVDNVLWEDTVMGEQYNVLLGDNVRGG